MTQYRILALVGIICALPGCFKQKKAKHDIKKETHEIVAKTKNVKNEVPKKEDLIDSVEEIAS